ncbi:hypothetical protein [Prosthecobacter sp.]|jgi:hypothetical protein|uniref:hypothetical protein n=1 Tax=Prosthecobacter sp. TaxID=1965333 RepID=UPI0037C8361C
MKRIFAVFNSGGIIPFLTSTHLEELAHHENDVVVAQRIDFIRRIPHIAFPNDALDDYVGGPLELRENEMGEVLTHSKASHEEVVAAVKPSVTSGYLSGRDFCERFEESWMANRKMLSSYALRQNAEVASVTHFSLPGYGWDDRFPDPHEASVLRPREEARLMFGHMAGWLSEKMQTKGDHRLRSNSKVTDQMAGKLYSEVFEESAQLHTLNGNPVENLLKLYEVDRERLPPKPTHGDVGYEAIFIAQHRIFERRLLLPSGTLRSSLRQDTVPSWVIWREVDREVKRLAHAEGSSLMDKMLLPFSLYLDAFEVDKRIYHCVRQAAKRCPLVKQIEQKIFKSGGIDALASSLELISKRLPS